ncbi:hypothetical protein PhCBS80983_g01502 [Powellomyces hirtus]|uniref:Coronin n=1 Tax=Powellomyces hirtus TaxID=109895 RepID=A0A507EAX8_9FUNG|nr:hypothetical protein PhCBS80983_g01502 [Powellomyces hirtus]
MKRFQNISKYRNAVLSAAKREEWYSFSPSQLNVSGDQIPIHASGHSVAFRSGVAGNTVGIQSLSKTGRSAPGAPHIHIGAHVCSLQFSPWNTSGEFDTLAVGGDEGTVKLFDLPWETDNATFISPSWTQTCHDRRVEDLVFHPSAGGILTTAGGSHIKVWDVSRNDPVFTLADVGEVAQSISWKESGSLLASASKDNLLRMFDPRQGVAPIASGQAHTGIKASKVIWIGNTDLLFTTGFSQRRDREYGLWDSRNLSKPIILNKVDTSPGVITPLYDSDTAMMFLVGKGDSRINWIELQTEGTPSVTPGVLAYSSGSVVSGATLVPKAALNVMDCEVARLLTVASDGSAIIPVTVVVPRKSHADFHADIFPETLSGNPRMDVSKWLEGGNVIPERISLDPKLKTASTEEMGRSASTPSASPATAIRSNVPLASTSQARELVSPVTVQIRAQDQMKASPPASPRAAPKFALPKASSYRFVTGKSQSVYEDLKGLSTSVPSESSALEVNGSLLAFPLTGPGGRIGIWPVNKPGRLPVTIPAIVCGSDLMDFQWNPFDHSALVTVTDDGKVRIWNIPSEGLTSHVGEPVVSFTAHTNRATISLFHPTIRDLLLTASPEQGSPTVKLWNARTQKEILTITHPDMILGCGFSWDGTKLATVCRDKLIRVFDLHDGMELQKGPSHEGIKACRVIWLKDGNVLTVGFARGSQREIRVYDSGDLSTPLHSTTIDTSPSLLMPLYDPDTAILYLSGRGESYTMMFEITDSGPQYLTRFDSAGTQQGLMFLPKTACDVRLIEIAKGYRITQTSIETVSFTVPRLKKEYFQDDIYPPTRDVSRPLLDVDQWMQREKASPAYVDLAPPDMTPLSQAPQEIKEQPRAVVLDREQTEAEIKAAGLKLMFEQAREAGAEQSLPQDEVEGVDDDEWDD